MAGFAEIFVRSPDGLNLFARDYAPEGATRGLPVLCLHGLTRNSADFEVAAPRIAATGRRVLAVDVRGRGRSDWDPKPDRYRPDVYTQDVLQLLDAVGVAKAVFVGTSMGGIMTMIAGSVAPERVSAAVLNDVGPILATAGIARIAGYVGKNMSFGSWDDMIAATRAVQGKAHPDADAAFWSRAARRVAREMPDGRVAFAYDPAIANAFAAAPAGPVDMTPLFQALARVPLLLVRGQLSDLLSPEGVAAMRVIKPDMEFAEVPRVGHAPTLEEPVAWRALAEFLARVD